MQIQGVVDFDDGIVPANPLAISSRRTELVAVREESRRNLGLPLLSIRFVELGQARRWFGVLLLLDVSEIEQIGGIVRIVFGKGSEFLASGVAQIAIDIHRLMIADERVHVAARFGGLLFQVHQQVHGAARFGTAVHHVAHLHEMGFAASPGVLLIDHAGGAQQRDELLVIPSERRLGQRRAARRSRCPERRARSRSKETGGEVAQPNQCKCKQTRDSILKHQLFDCKQKAEY